MSRSSIFVLVIFKKLVLLEFSLKLLEVELNRELDLLFLIILFFLDLNNNLPG